MIWTFIEFLFVSFVLNTFLYFFLKKKNFLLDCPFTEKHKIHSIDAVRCGGIGIYLSFLIGFFFFDLKYQKTFMISTLSFILGLIEDLYKGINPKLRFSILVLISVLLLIIKPEIILTNLGIFKIPFYIGVLFTIFAIVGFTNSINISDGLNGLSSGIILNASFFIILVSYLNKDYETLKFITILAGSIMGFFIINFFTGRIFLGDGGAYFLGIIMAIISLYISNTYKEISPWFFLVIFSYPVTDTVFSIYRRYIKNKKIFHSDTLHMHILLNKRVFKNQMKSAFLIIVISFIFSLIAFEFRKESYVLAGIHILYVTLYISGYRGIISSQKKIDWD
jgi:UDP-N-acetylmuramyl pentapeptide phosphotransferase/UDP-N-acetylglucosamine-1-phosphate transferase